ncbi:collagen-binding domain-containing protein [Paenibacillus rhizoplanae]
MAGLLTLSSAFTWGTDVRAASGVPYTPTPVLGVAGNFNAFILGDFKQANDQIEGRLAAAGGHYPLRRLRSSQSIQGCCSDGCTCGR